jgi:hypothetical protein
VSTAWAALAAAALSVFALPQPAPAESILSVGPRNIQSLLAEALFDRAGRWYLIDDGGCQSLGKECVGADFASNVVLSGKLRGSGHVLVLGDIRIDRVDDESARTALNLALQVDPQILPRSANIDVSEFVKKNVIAAGGSPARLDEFRIASISTRNDGVVIHFDLSLSVP